MSPPLPAQSLVHDALLIVGTFTKALGVERSPVLIPVREWWLPPMRPPMPVCGGLTTAEALGWTVLAAWIEQGGHPIERVMRRGGTTTIGWRVTFVVDEKRFTWSRASASIQDHARVGELAAALLVLRRWTTPVRPWGLRDLQAEALDRIAREAGVKVSGPQTPTLIHSPIPKSYLDAHGTASE